RLVEEKGVEWRMVRSALTVHSDKRMLEEMLRNLLSNAIRYTDGGKILLGCRRGAGCVRIEVWDSGVGITKDQLPYIFEEYYQGAEGVRRGGFRIGFAIGKRIGKNLCDPVEGDSPPREGPGFFI